VLKWALSSHSPNGLWCAWRALQTFRTTEDPAILFNGNNEYLHYEDTWYILGYKPDSYVVSAHLLVGSWGRGTGWSHATQLSACLSRSPVPPALQDS
jgi:hypothetical protein